MDRRCRLSRLRSIPDRTRATRARPAAATLALLLAQLVVLGGPAAAAAQDAPTIDDLAWIGGHWAGEAFGGDIEEAWFSPAGGAMSGSFRLVIEGRARMYELLLLETDPDGSIYYRFKHVMPGWVPREETRLEYRLTELEGRKATFRSTSDTAVPGAPFWFTYESPRDDRLIVTIHGTEPGDEIVLIMTRA
jgi:hypothetical protein